MAEPWPRKYHLQIAQSEESGDFAGLIAQVLSENKDCIEIESSPQRVGVARNGNVKYRGCVVKVRDVLCMIDMCMSLQRNSIICRPRRYQSGI